MSNLLHSIPKPLLEDIVDNHCVPIIGAGFSRNADLPQGLEMPIWRDLGKAFAAEIDKNYPYSNPLDAMSAYAQEFSRVKLIEKLSDFLYIQEAEPGNAFSHGTYKVDIDKKIIIARDRKKEEIFTFTKLKKMKKRLEKASYMVAFSLIATFFSLALIQKHQRRYDS